MEPSQRLHQLLLDAAHIRQRLLEHERQESAQAAAGRARNSPIAMLERMTDGFLAIDHTFRIIYANQKAQQLLRPLQASAYPIIGKNIWRVFPQLKAFEFYRALHRAAALSRTEQLEEFLPPLNAWLETRIYASEEGLSVYLLDVSPRTRAEQQQTEALALEKEARAEAERASRLKDQFLAVMSHELRTPLTAILGYARMLRNRHLDASVVPMAVETIERNAKLQAQLIDDLLDHSRIRAGKLRLELSPVDLAEIISDATDASRMAAETKRIRLSLLPGPSPVLVTGDASRLQQVVSNLLNNSIKFTPEGGAVEVHLETSDSQAKIIVKDSGLGIVPGFLPHVFEAFRQAEESSKRSYGGLGLGLSLVRHLVEMHGGHVAAASAGRDQGATFTVTLPLRGAAGAKPHPAGREDSAGAAVSLRGLRILMVENHTGARHSLAAILQRFGAKVIAAESMACALAALAKSRPDVLVSDVARLGEDGCELIRKVRALGSEDQIPAIALTARAEFDENARVLAAGYNMYLPKPVDPGVLAAAIAVLAGGSYRQEISHA